MANQDYVAKLKLSNENAKKSIKELKDEINSLKTQNKLLGQSARKVAGESNGAWKMWGDTLKSNTTLVGKLQRKLADFKEPLDTISKKFTGMDFMGFAKFGSIAGGIGLVADQFITSSKKAIEFEDSLSNLSAITGQSGQDLENLKQQIIETGNATSKSFTTIADSYTKVGSKMPELLQQPKALDAVTRSVITLSKAARMDLDSATESLTGIMNQMGASASESAKYINVLAAGSKNGAGDIQYLSTAMNKAGTSIKSAGLSIEQGTALIEVLAQKIPDAATAGTNLRNILLKMMQGADEFNPKVVGLSTALDNLSKHTSDTTFMVKMFGSENVNAAITLAESTKKCNELTDAVTGTNEAELQAKTQTDNVAGAVKRLQQDWENFITSLNNSQGAIKTVINLLDGLIKSWQWALSAKNAYEDAGDRGTSGAQETSENYKRESTTNNAGDAKKAYQEYKRKMEASIADAERSANKLIEDGVNAESKSRQKTLYNAAHQAKMRAEELRKQLAKVTENDFKPVVEVNTNTDTNTDKNKKTNVTKTESALERYEREMSVAVAKYNAGLTNQKEYFDDQIKAIQTYLSELTKDTKSMKTNRSVIDSLTKKVKELKSASSVLNITQNVYKEFAKSTEKYNDGIINQEEYIKEYRNSLQKVINSLYDVDNLNEEQKKAQKDYIQKLKDFDVKLDNIAKDYQKKVDSIDFNKKVLTSEENVRDIKSGETPNELYQLLRQESIERKNLLKVYQVEKQTAQKRAETVGVEFNLDSFDTEFATKYSKILSDAGIKNNGNGTLEQEIKFKLVEGEPTFDEFFENKKWTENWKGDKSNYSLNTTSNQQLSKQTDFRPQLTGVEKYQDELNKLLDMHKKIEEVQVNLAKQQYDAGELDYQVDTTELDNLEKQITEVGKKLKDALNTEMKIEGIDKTLQGISTLGHTVEMWRDMGETVANAKDGFSAFLSVFDGVVSTFETVNGLIKLYNSLQELFGGVTAASTVATEGLAAAEGSKSASDATNTATAIATATAMKAEQVAALDLASALIFAAHASIPFAGVGIASGQVESMLGAMSGFKAQTLALGSFAGGGIIPGASVAGDNISASVNLNSGEMILNTRQQKNLFDLLDSGVTVSNNNLGGLVKFRIEGKELVGVLNNYNTSKSKLR